MLEFGITKRSLGKEVIPIGIQGRAMVRVREDSLLKSVLRISK